MEYFRSGYNACLLDLTHETMTSAQLDAAARTSFLSIFSKLSDESYQAFSTTIKPVSNEKVESFSSPCSRKPSEVSVIVKNNEDIDQNNNPVKKTSEKKTITKRKIFKPGQTGEKKKKIGKTESFMRQLENFDSDIDEEVFTDILLTTTAIPEVKISIGKTSTINTNSKEIATSLPQIQPPNLFHPHFIMERKLLGMREPPKASVNKDGEGKGITTTVFSTHSKSCSGQSETEVHQIKPARDSFRGINKTYWPRDRSLLPPVTVFL